MIHLLGSLFTSPLSTRFSCERLEDLALVMPKNCQPCYKMLTFMLFFLLLHSRTTIAAPFQNLTDTKLTLNWESGPSGRGSADILYNSACTLALCVWNSVHLNIPAVREDKWDTYRRKIKWVIIALLAPELLVFTAFQQWLAARKFLEELRHIQGERAPEVGTHIMPQEILIAFTEFGVPLTKAGV